MSTILMSIKPEYVDQIFQGKKKYEYRKKLCKNEINNIIIYASLPVQKVVGELIIDEVLYNKKDIIWDKTCLYGGISKDKYDKYFDKNDYAVAYKIKNFIIYDNQKDLSYYNIKHAPQSYIYIK